ncbi:unnamed protein product [Absidia cylindrospora]
MAASMKYDLVKDIYPSSSPYKLDYHDSSDTLVATMEHQMTGEKEPSALARRKRRHSLLRHWKVVLERFNNANEQWHDSRAMKRQRRHEKRPQDGKTNPFE